MERKLLMYNYGPAIIVNLLFLPLWFIPSPFFTYNVSMFQTIFNVALLPIYLVILNFRFALRGDRENLFSFIGTMWLVIFVANLLSYLNWGLATGQLFVPEYGTLYLYEWLLITSFSAVLVLTAIGQFALNYMRKRTLV